MLNRTLMRGQFRCVALALVIVAALAACRSDDKSPNVAVANVSGEMIIVVQLCDGAQQPVIDLGEGSDPWAAETWSARSESEIVGPQELRLSLQRPDADEFTVVE